MLLQKRQSDNSILNEQEFQSRQILLKSSPQTFFLQAAGPCNSSCAFCSRGKEYQSFNLAIHRERFENKLNQFLEQAQQIVLTGSGEFLQLPQPEKILDYFDDNFPHVEKAFSTNGSSLTPKICEKIAASKSKYTIHVSLHAADSKLHNVLTRTDNFTKIVDQLNYLLKLRKSTGNPTLRLIFVATTLNIENLPDFVRLAADLGAERVICYYNYIYVFAQKYLSCFFKQELTNCILDQAEKIASDLKVKIDLPPRFGLKDYPAPGICREPWSQIMLDAQGQIIPCDASEDANISLRGLDFMQAWNSNYFQNLRKKLIAGSCSCFGHCFRANPKSVNDFSAHVIHRGRQAGEINILWGDNF